MAETTVYFFIKCAYINVFNKLLQMQFLLMEKPTSNWSKDTIDENEEKLGEFYTCCSEISLRLCYINSMVVFFISHLLISPTNTFRGLSGKFRKNDVPIPSRWSRLPRPWRDSWRWLNHPESATAENSNILRHANRSSSPTSRRYHLAISKRNHRRVSRVSRPEKIIVYDKKDSQGKRFYKHVFAKFILDEFAV